MAILVIKFVKVFPQVICANFSFTAGPMVRTFKRVNICENQTNTYFGNLRLMIFGKDLI